MVVIDNISLITDEQVSPFNDFIPALFLQLLQSSPSDSIKQHIIYSSSTLFSIECVQYAFATLRDSLDFLPILNAFKGQQTDLDTEIEKHLASSFQPKILKKIIDKSSNTLACKFFHTISTSDS